MTLPRVIRIFFAIDLPLEIKEQLGKFIGDMKKKAKTHGIRWTKPENLHITLQFLAEIQAQDVQKMIEMVRKEVVGNIQQASFQLGALQVFPNPYRPRVIVLDILPQERLAALSARIGNGIVATQYAIEERPFRAHLTLGRIKQPKEVRLDFLSLLTVPVLNPLNLEEIVLFRSEPQQDGSKYTMLEKIIL